MNERNEIVNYRYQNDHRIAVVKFDHHLKNIRG
jgi:hypothetical protein